MSNVNINKQKPDSSEKHPAKKPPEKQGEVPRKRDDSQEG